MKTAIITAAAALTIAAPAFAQDIDGNAIVMTRSVPAENILSVDDSGLGLESVNVTFGTQILQDVGVTEAPQLGNVTTAYVFGGIGDTGNNDFSGR